MGHTFEVNTQWKTGTFSGTIEPQAVSPAIGFGVPKEFGGPGGEWTPEHFLAAAVSTCVQATFLMVARASKAEISGYEARCECTMAQKQTGFEVTSVTLAPRITVADDANRERAERAIEKAEQLCPISKALDGLVHLEAEVVVS